MITVAEIEPTITLSNFRVTYRAPRYEDGRVLYDGYCAILANDAAFNGAEVRVFDVPDADEGQLAAAMFACEAMNQHERLIEALRDEIAALEIWQGMKLPPDIRNGIQISLSKLRTALATTTGK